MDPVAVYYGGTRVTTVLRSAGGYGFTIVTTVATSFTIRGDLCVVTGATATVIVKSPRK